MKIRLAILFIFFACSVGAQVNLEQLRREYSKASGDSALCMKLYRQLNEQHSSEYLFMAYQGALSCALANHVRNKTEKLKHFSSGKKMLEQAISMAPRDPELRFLRLTVQSNCPQALGYRKNISEDQDFLVKNIALIKNAAFQKKIVSWLQTSASLTETQKQQLNQTAQ